ncbi:unnamed protein product [Phytophthora fragariaefolia]|uniref:Unnamed protein product n=1 Tax=Phytophthora fragariaefolia TaxID=1490495 RepID=A0A9W6XW69_9STRA|nr:unnamed protein product [Phytophthora fragariaefolia]
MGDYCEIDMGGSEEVRSRTRPSDRQKLWVTRGDRWVPTYVVDPGRPCSLRLTNVSERKLILHEDTKIAMWLAGDRVPRLPGYVSVGSRRYAGWQNLAYQATTDENSVTPRQEEVQGPAVERPLYPTPTSILRRPPTCPAGTAAARQIKGRGLGCTQIATSRAHDATNEADMCSAHVLQNRGQRASNPDRRLNPSANQRRDQRRVEEGSPNPDGLGDSSGGHIHIPTDDATSTHSASVDLGNRTIDPGDEEVCIKESGDLYAEDVKGHLAVLPEVTPTTEEVKIEDIQVGDPNDNTQEQVDQPKQIIWRRRHLLIGKGNGLPPAAKGAICDIDMGNAKPVAQRARKVAPQFREKMFQLIKGSLSAQIIQHSTSPCASPIVVIIKKNGVDIRVCIDYRLVNSLTRLMVYPMPLTNDLLDDLDKVLWYCSLDMASGFWVVSMTDRARAISAFITPFGLFEWNHHQARDAGEQDQQRPIDLFQDGEPDTDKESSVLGRRSYIDDILIDFFEASGQAKARLGGDDQEQQDKWTRATNAFVLLKDKIIHAPILTHFDPDKRPVVILYASKWAISAALVQEHEGVYKPVPFTSRTLKPNEINYGIVDKEGEDEIVGVIAVSITPRKEVDSILTSIAPRKQPRQVISMPPPTVGSEEELLVVSFDGSARVKRVGGAFSAIVWSLPDWTEISGASEYKTNLTINEAEYHGLLLCFDLPATQHVNHYRLNICGDSNPVIRQMRGEIECKAPSLKLLRQKAMEKLRSWPNHEFLHVKRNWNQSADKLASAALQREAGEQVTYQTDIDDLATLNRLAELLVPQSQISVVKIAATTRARQRRNGEVLQEPLLQRMRMERISRAQDEEKWIVDLKKYLTGDVRELTSTEAKSCAKIAEGYEIDEVGLLFYCPPSKQSCEDRDLVTRLVIPETLQEDVHHHYHTSLEGGHQGIGRTYQRIRARFHWRGLYRSVQQYVGQCVDCETGKGRSTMEGESPGNHQATYPLQIIAMDHIPSLPKSYKGNTELLIWIDLLTGYVIAKASVSRTAQTIAENYEECVFRRFGASEAIRHDREPGFMAEFFRSFNKIAGQKQRATMAYRPQANGTAERMVQTLTRSVKMYVSDINQRDWDEYAERLTFALNTAQDRVRGDTPFYLMHGWDPRTTLEAMIPLGSTRRRDREPRRWRYHVQRHYQQAREVVYEMRSKAGLTATMSLSTPTRSKLVPLVIEDQDRFDFDEALFSEDSWDTSLAEGEYEVERITDMRSGRRTRYGRNMREFLVHWKGYQEPTWVDEADLNCGALLHDYLRRQANQHRFNVMQSHEAA